MSLPDRSYVQTDRPSQPPGEILNKSQFARRFALAVSLLPREHGAYAGIAFPLITGLSLGDAVAAQLLWISGCLAVFLIHEPLMVMLGERGRRSHTELGVYARQAAYGLAAFALMAGGVGWWLADQAARVALLLPFALAAALCVLIVNHRERTVAGELLASLTLSSVIVPVALAGGAGLRSAITAGAVWCIVSVLATLTVRATIARAKQAGNHRPLVWAAVLCSASALLAAYFLVLTNVVTMLVALAVLPTMLLAAVFLTMHVHPRHLRAMGWSLVATYVITWIALVSGLT